MKLNNFDERDFHWKVKEIAKKLDDMTDDIAEVMIKIDDKEWLAEELKKRQVQFSYLVARIRWWEDWLEKYISKINYERQNNK